MPLHLQGEGISPGLKASIQITLFQGAEIPPQRRRFVPPLRGWKFCCGCIPRVSPWAIIHSSLREERRALRMTNTVDIPP